ncbi:MAG: YceI family protein [Firmicutes bacterium]|nr:YceI family protein [Bacillota bacterium]
MARPLFPGRSSSLRPSHPSPLAWFLIAILILGAGCGRQQPTEHPEPAPAAATGPEQPQAGTAGPEVGTAQPGATRYQVVAGESKAAYRATEKFVNRELPNEAVGVSTAVEGEFLVSPDGTLQAGTVRVDLRQLKSDSARRDSRLRTQWLESDRYPWAEFTLAEPVSLAAADGQPAEVTIVGDLTVKEVRRRVTFTGTVTRTGESLRIQARAQVKMTDFGIEPPNIAGFLKVDDPLVLEGDLVARPAG